MKNKITKVCILTSLIIGGGFLSGCNNEQDKTVSKLEGLDISLFVSSAFISKPEIVDCTTSAGTETKCYKLITTGSPAGREPGDFCPRTIHDKADTAGGWFNKEGSGDLIDLTGQFIVDLPTYYNDPNWKLYDPETGKVRYTGTKEGCLGAAKPDVEEEYKQNCIECKMSYLEDDFSRTYLIPVKPIMAKETSRVRTAGVALDGAELSGPAPVGEILGAYTIAAFDDCGGHINVHQGYHYHSVVGCSDASTKNKDDYAPLVGYAPDGYAIYAMRDGQGNEAASLDECRGMTDSVRGYHYRAASPSENMIIGCLRGEFIMPKRKGPPHGGHPPHNKDRNPKAEKL